MPANKDSYNILLDALDVGRLSNILEQLKRSQEEIEPILSPLQISNLSVIKPVYGDMSDEGIIRTHYLMCFETISENIKMLSMHSIGIKNVFINFPWDSLEKISEILVSSIESKKYDEYLHHKECVDNDIAELVLRISYMRDATLYTRTGVIEVLQEDGRLDNSDRMIREKYKDLKFASQEPIIQGLYNIRKITEPSLDYKKFEQIKHLISNVELCNPETDEGRASILATTFMIGEVGKTISDQVKNLNPTIPFRHLKQFRDKVHDLDTICKSKSLITLINYGIEHFHDLKNFIVTELKPQIEVVNIPTFEISNPRNRHNPLTDIASRLSDNEVTKGIEIIKQILPKDIRKDDEISIKLDICFRVLSGNLPLPIFGTKMKFSDLVFTIFQEEIQEEGNIIRAINKNHDALEHKDRKSISKDIAHLKHLDIKLSYQYMADSSPQNPEQEIMCLKELESGLDKIAKTIPQSNPEQYIQNQLELLIESLEQITIHTDALLKGTKNYQEARERCSNIEFHFFHLFHLIVIGQAIHNLIGKEGFTKYTTADLLKEFEFLKWVRNSLMHNKEVDETGSVFSYFKNDLLDLNIREHGARAYDSNEYLQYLRPLIEDTLKNIQQAKAQDDLTSNQDEFIQHLIYQKLKIAYKNNDEKSETLLLKALGVGLKDDTNIHYQVGEVLELSPLLDLVGRCAIYPIPGLPSLPYCHPNHTNGFLEYKEQILEIASKFNINIIGLFGNIVDNGFVAITEEQDITAPHELRMSRSGILVEQRGSDIELASFKRELNSILQHRLLVVTEEQIREYLYSVLPTLPKENIVESIEEQTFGLPKFYDRVRANSIERVSNGMKLCQAIENGESRDKIAELLATNPDLNVDLKYHGYTSLHKTCMSHNINYDTFVLLVRNSANVNIQDKHGNTVAHYIASGEVGEGWDVIASLTLLEEYGADFNLTDYCGLTPFQSSSKHYHTGLEAYRFLLQHSNLPIEEKLMQAIKQEKIDDVRLFLGEIASKGQATVADILNTEIGNHGLIGHIACGVGNREIIDLLVGAGSDLMLVAEDGTTALESACSADNADQLNPEDRIALMTYLIDEVHIPISSGSIYNSLYCSDLKILQLLLDKGGDPNTIGVMTPLLVLINQPCVDDAIQVIEILLTRGADILAIDGHVGNSLHLAAERGHIKVVEQLLSHASKTNQLEQLLQPSPCMVCQGMNPFEIALRYGNIEIAVSLKKYFNTEAYDTETSDNTSPNSPSITNVIFTAKISFVSMMDEIVQQRDHNSIDSEVLTTGEESSDASNVQ